MNCLYVWLGMSAEYFDECKWILVRNHLNENKIKLSLFPLFFQTQVLLKTKQKQLHKSVIVKPFQFISFNA